MTNEGFLFFTLLMGSIAIGLDYGIAGKYLLDIARDGRRAGKPQPFIKGLGWLLFTTIGFNWFWIVVLIANSFVAVPPLVIAVAYALLVTAAITGRWRWWRQIIPAVKNGHKSEEFPDNAP